MLHVRVYNRAFTAPLILPLELGVEAHSWAAIGGPDQATIQANGDVSALWRLLETLRCPIEVYADNGVAVWWGYVAEVEVQAGAVSMNVSLDDLANRVAVAYAYTASTDLIGTRATTSWEQDDLSVDEYGTFERLESSSSDDTATATALRDAVLDSYKWPLARPGIEPGANDVSGTLHCRGWWSLFGRRFYDNTGTSLVETTEQIEDIVTAAGEFVTRVDIEDASGVSALEYRDGDTNAQEELEALLNRGNSSGRRMLGIITQERVLRVYNEPDRADAYQLQSDGRLLDTYGARLSEGYCIAGAWLRLVDVVPATVNTTVLSDPSLIFVESSEWDESRGCLTNLEPRGTSIYNVAGLESV